MTEPLLQRLKVLWSKQFLLYVLGGVLSALVDVGTMQLLITQQIAPAPAAAAGYLVALVLNFAFHAKVTFGGSANARTVARFACLVAFNCLLTVGLVGLAQWLTYPALWGKLVSLPLMVVTGFLLGKYWIFK